MRRRRGRGGRGGRRRAAAHVRPGLRRARGASAIHLEQWPLDDADAVAARVPALIAAGVGALALTSPALSRLRPAIERASGGELPVVEAGDVAAQRVQRTLRHAGLLARRRRPGRLIVISSNPSRAAGPLSAECIKARRARSRGSAAAIAPAGRCAAADFAAAPEGAGRLGCVGPSRRR